MSAPAHKAICLNGVTPAEVTYGGFAEALAGRAVLLLKDLEGYASDYPTNYDWETEVTAIARLTAKRGWQQFQVMGGTRLAQAWPWVSHVRFPIMSKACP